MNLDWIKELPSKETPMTKNFFQKLSTSILDYAFPIGKTEMFFDNEDHSNYLGFKWERTCIGRVPVGIDSNDTDFNSIGKTGGEKKHTLSVSEMPSHNHNVTIKALYGNASNPSSEYYNINPGNGTNWGNRSWLNYSDYVGGGQAHNNLQPYEVVAFWKRVE